VLYFGRIVHHDRISSREAMTMKMRKCWCARCGQTLTVASDLVETRIKCEACHYIQPIPESDDYSLDGQPVESESSTYALGRVSDQASSPAVRPLPDAALPEVEKARRLRWHGDFHDGASHVQGLSVGLLLISAADLLMTFTLLQKSPAFYESNPIAQWVFVRWNMAGMVMFKFSLIAFVIVLGEIIERRRPRLGKAVLLLGCLATAYAFVHGFRLYMGHTEAPPGD
jgi:hypothetical protein